MSSLAARYAAKRRRLRYCNLPVMICDEVNEMAVAKSHAQRDVLYIVSALTLKYTLGEMRVCALLTETRLRDHPACLRYLELLSSEDVFVQR